MALCSGLKTIDLSPLSNITTSTSAATAAPKAEVSSVGLTDFFVVPGLQSLAGGPSLEHRLRIATVDLPANVTYTAVPKLSTKVLTRALIRNASPKLHPSRVVDFVQLMEVLLAPAASSILACKTPPLLTLGSPTVSMCPDD